MTTAVTKATNAKNTNNSIGKSKPKDTVKMPPTACPLADTDRSSPFQALHDGLESIREFVRTIDAWEDFEDAIQAMAAVGLLQRVVYRLEGHAGPVLRADDGCLDAALDKAIRPRR